MKKLLVICGPTATGKTSLGLYLAIKFNGEIISADSRQVYKGMDVGTGKELPVNLKFKIQNSKLGGRYCINGINVWGYDLVEPTVEFSVSQYYKIISPIIINIWKREKIPIIVGGTGLYIKAITGGIETIDIPQNKILREKLDEKSPKVLFRYLKKINPKKADLLNISDKKNPRRLVRAIECSLYNDSIKINANTPHNQLIGIDTVSIGLKASKQYLSERIKKRVFDRINHGFENEVRMLLGKGVNWSNQSMQSLGYRQYKDCFLGKINSEDFVNLWIREEIQYSKRQMTWFKKNNNICWFDITNKGFVKDVENMIKKWHNE